MRFNEIISLNTIQWIALSPWRYHETNLPTYLCYPAHDTATVYHTILQSTISNNFDRRTLQWRELRNFVRASDLLKSLRSAICRRAKNVLVKCKWRACTDCGLWVYGLELGAVQIAGNMIKESGQMCHTPCVPVERPTTGFFAKRKSAISFLNGKFQYLSLNFGGLKDAVNSLAVFHHLFE